MAEDNNLCIVSYGIKEELQVLSAIDWLDAIKLNCGASSVESREDSNPMYAMIKIENDGEKGIFCLKMRDYVIQHANAFLRTKGLVPDIEDDDEDEMVFGDDDFEM